jgi:uncharacterized protein (TIGR00369 family)
MGFEAAMTLKLDKETIQTFLDRDFGPLGADFRMDRVDETGITLRLKVTPQHLRPGNVISGPSMFALADVAVYLAILSRIGMVPMTVTTNCSIDFMRMAAADRDLLAEARVLKLGRSLAVGDVLLYSEGLPDPVARAGLTYAIPTK